MHTSHRSSRASRRRVTNSYIAEALERRTLLAFGVTDTGSSFVVDTGAQTVFTISKTNGDVLSMKYNGTDMQAPNSLTGRYSHYESGLSSTTTSVTSQVDAASGWIKITAADTGTLGVTQYYMARSGDNDIYMATYTASATAPSPGEMRFIAYMNYSMFTNHPDASDTNGGTAIEGSDVYQKADGTTHSKFYDALRFIDDSSHGITGIVNGQSVGAYMMIGSHETSSGGPFFKDIDFQATGSAVEMYNYMYSGHTQTESFRSGLQGPYAIQFTNGTAPVALDYSFMDSMALQGWVSASGRGTLTGVASGVPAGDRVTVGLGNTTAEYWGAPDANGNYTITGIKPGTYTATLYDQELEVATASVTIIAGATTTQNIANTQSTPSTIWSIGKWDGTPIGFLNADKIQTMHPTDVRMNPWPASTTYTVGTSTPDSWPLVQTKDINNSSTVVFNLTSAQATSQLTLRIGDTFAYAGGRPYIVVNEGTSKAWTSAIPAAPHDLNSRGITRGTWRGNNLLYTYNIPTTAQFTGQNTIKIIVASGSTSTGWLSPSITYDAIDLLGPVATNAAPTVATPASASPNPVTSSTTNLSVLGADDGGEASLTYTWSATGPAAVTYSLNGTNAAKNATATFTAAGSYTFTCTITDAGGLTTTSSTNVTVDQTLTSISVSPASATVNTNATQQFTATANDQFGAALTAQPAFTWSVATGGGTIAATGLYTAPATAGSATLQAANGAIVGTASVTVVAPAVPAAPSSLTAAKVGKNKARLTWTDNASNESGFHVWSSRDGITWTLLTTVAASAGSGGLVSYNTGALATGTWYFKVTAYNTNGDSSDSNVASILI